VKAEGDTLDLTGLPAASPIGFMAAIGLLRVLAQDHGLLVALSWHAGRARLHGSRADEVRETLHRHMSGRIDAPEFQFEVAGESGNPMKVQHLRTLTPEDYRRAVLACQGDPRALGFLAGYATDAVVNDKGCVARTRFDFTSGQQRMVEEFRALAMMLDPRTRRQRRPLVARIDAALFGGPYEDQHSFGWDPSALMSHAHQPAAPSDSATPGQPMAVWLAVESLPLHPVVPVSAGRAETTGFAPGRAYVWPQWEEPLDLAEVTLLRARPVASLDALPGVTGVWRAHVTSVGKYGFFRPAARTRSDDGAPGRFAQAEFLDW
jgi:hypothetical protein